MEWGFRGRLLSFCKKFETLENGCWKWRGPSYRDGYGKFQIKKIKIKSAHRASYFLFKGAISTGLCVCHACDNKWCVNPNHLFTGTLSDNTLDALEKGRMRPPTRSKFDPKEIDRVVNEIRISNLRVKELSEKFGITCSAIYAIKSGKSYAKIK